MTLGVTAIPTRLCNKSRRRGAKYHAAGCAAPRLRLLIKSAQPVRDALTYQATIGYD